MTEMLKQRRRWRPVEPQPAALLLALMLVAFLHPCPLQARFVNQAPHFVPQTGDMTHFALPENTPVGTPVYQLRGVDPENGALHYSISGEHLSVERGTGVVTLVRPLDREHQDKLEVIISITDEVVGETEPNTVSLRRVIRVRDINDNAPVFHNRPYSVNISEAAVPGTELTVSPKIVVTDADEGVNAEVSVRCANAGKLSDSGACDAFTVNTHKISEGKFEVKIFVAKPLDYESRPGYVLSIEASDGAERALTSHASVAVSVRDVQDQPPVFLNGPFSATVPENTQPNTSIMDIIAKDGDSGEPRPILITLEGDQLGYFDVVSNRGTGRATIVTSNNAIDRENALIMQNGGVYSFFVKATELINNEIPSDYTISQMTIVVTDVDDHTPQFNQVIFDISIPENIEVGSPLPGLAIYVEDHDIGQNSRYNLSTRDVFNSDGVFSISTDHGEGKTPIAVKVINSDRLDYDIDEVEKRTFMFDIVASVRGEEVSSTRINIKLLDTNDNSPVFDKAMYKFNVLENATVGFKISNITATDKDYGIFSEIEYTLTGFGAAFFISDIHNGGLYVDRPLDYEKQKSYSLTMVAKDGGGKVSTASVFVELLDVNDNAPVFELSEYIRTIRDGSTTFEPQFVVRATDVDGPAQGGGGVKYSIESDNSITNNGNVFSINEDSGEITIVGSVESMDTPRGQYDIVVRATDRGDPPLYNDTRVSIRVGVSGNQRPTFKGNFHNSKYVNSHRNVQNEADLTYEMNPMNYKASVREDASPGQNVTTVIANDPDGLDTLLTYHIVSGSKDNFAINEKSGLITISGDANLDRDVNTNKYEVIVSAVDNGVPIPETATTTVYVTIQDVNNKPPSFNITDPITYISERTKIGTLVTKLVAFDSDLNSLLKYSIIEPIKYFSKSGVQLKSSSSYDYKSAFRINENTGEIFTNNTLDYSQVSIVILTIKVVDINAESNVEQQFAITEHTVYIQPYVDKNPQFTNAVWSLSNPTIVHTIQEEQPIGSTLLVLMADDPISGHMVTNFKVINSETDLLQVDPQSGQVVLAKRLDYENMLSPNLTLTVKATSNDGSKYSIAKVIIEVININDNSPKFDNNIYKVSVLESVKHSEIVLTVQATDNDAIITDRDKDNGYSVVQYSIKGENADLFIIDADTGVIQVGGNKSLDREQQSVLRVEVEAADTPRGGAGRLRSTALVLVDVLDVNDNPPAFDKPNLTAVVPENVQAGTSVTNMTATDPDEGLGGEITYEILDEGEANGLFTIEQKTGEIKTRRALTGRGRSEPYRLVVLASDGGGLAAHAPLTLYIGDVSTNDGVPRFIQPASDRPVNVSENIPIGSPVFQVVASDPDDPSLPSGQLIYSIQQNNADADAFIIDGQSGVIRTRVPLDRERMELYRLVVVARDRGVPAQQTARVLTIRVTDQDDHKPRFKRQSNDSPVVMKTLEEIPLGTEVGRLQAVDEDIGSNGAIDYVIFSGNELGLFKVERTEENSAVVKAAGRLDREQAARHLLSIKCFKLGASAALQLNKPYNRLDPSEIQVMVNVVDIDDHLPVFESLNRTVGVRLNVPVDTALATLRAVDLDPDAPPVRYSLLNVTFRSPIAKSNPYEGNASEVFALNTATGELRTLKNLLHFADGTFRLSIRANNSNNSGRYSDTELNVVVVRERELLRFVWGHGASAVRATLPEFRAAVAAALASHGLALTLHDAAPLVASDRTVDFSSTGSCFQLWRGEEALNPRAMRAALKQAETEMGRVYARHGVREVTSCAMSSPPDARARLTQHALLALAALLALGALLATLVLCCLHDRYRRASRKCLLGRDGPAALVAAPASYTSGAPGRLHAGPLHSAPPSATLSHQHIYS